MKYLPILFLLFSCYTPKIAERRINKVQVNYPSIVAEKVSLWYPCVPISTKTDSTAYKEWLNKFDSIKVPITDTIIDTILLNRVCPERKILIRYKELIRVMPTLHDTIRVENTSYKTIIADLTKDNKELNNKFNGALKFCISLLIALIVSILVNFLKR